MFANPAAWAGLKAEASLHGVAPLVAYHARPFLGSEERVWCDRVLSSSWRSHDKNLRTLCEVAGLLQANDIPAIALKGPVLACRYYSPVFLRKPSGDLDLALREEDLGRACDALRRIGYASVCSIRAAKRVSHHLVLERRGSPSLELHFRLSSGVLGIPAGACFPEARHHELPGGGSVRILSAADELLHLVLHLVQDRFVTLFHFQEVRRIWMQAAPEMRTEAVSRAIDYGFCGVLKLADIAVRSRWGERLIPDDTVLPDTWLGWRVTESLYRRMELFSRLRGDRTFAGRLVGRLADVQLADTPARAAAVAGSAALTIFR